MAVVIHPTENENNRPFQVGFSPPIPTEIVHAATELSPILEKITSLFWNAPVSVRFNALSFKNLYFWRNDNFYVSQLPLGSSDEINANQILQLRVSASACACLLNQSLGQREGGTEFQVNQITNFEAQILTEFSKELFACFLKNMVNRKVSAKNPGSLIHLAWGVRLNQPSKRTDSSVPDDELTGRILLTLPLENFRHAKPKKELGPLGDNLFLDAHAEGTIWVGKTRIAIDELQELENGDIVVLDESQVNQMALMTPETRELILFNTEFNNHSELEIPFTPEPSMETSMKENDMSTKDQIWDNLMLDVNAEFFPTRLPLNQLKQMSEGLILEVGDLTQNDIRLHIEGKTVALGELVIVGEKFGVRIKEVKDKHEAVSSAPTEIIPLNPNANNGHPLESPPAEPPQTQQNPQPQVAQGAQPASESAKSGEDEWMNDDFDDDDGDEW